MKSKVIISISLLIFSVSIQAQTGGPGQPEFMQFKPATATDLVNPSNGSFSYNIPLFDVGGYPVNLSYQSGIDMEQVSSIVGLGWNINIGAINHTIRGIPDDFRGDIVKRTIFMKPNITYGGNLGLGAELVGIGLGLKAGFGVFYNNYNGYGVEESFGATFSMHNKSKTSKGGISLGMKANSQTGVDLYAQPTVSMQLSNSTDLSSNGSLGGMVSINSREGIKGSINVSMDISGNLTHTTMVKDAETGLETTEVKSKQSYSLGRNASAAYSFSKTPEIPRVSYPFVTKSFTGNFKAGSEVLFLHPNGELSGYSTSQMLSTNYINTRAYGFLYSDQAPAGVDNVLHDFSREKDQPYIKDASVNIGIPYYTNDIYSVNAQGISGSFQLNRGDIGVIFDNQVSSGGNALNIGIELGLGAGTHVGADLSSTTTTSNSGKWDSNITPCINFKSKQPNSLYQSAYFKNASDVSVDENDFFKKLNGDKAIEVKIEDTQFWKTNVDTEKKFIDENDNIVSAVQIGNPDYLTKVTRDARTVNIVYKTAIEAKEYGIIKTIDDYKVNYFDCSRLIKKYNRVDNSIHMGHHISEIIAINTDGMRYVFGLPTYNTFQKEVSFTLNKSRIPDSEGLATFDPNVKGDDATKDGFYESTELPPYVTSHLLTAVLSPDYIDVDNNGPSLNDVGNYVKVNYSYAGLYKWRTPFGANQATFNKALLSDDTDNKGSYVFGVKEIWYTHSIESKTQIAEFYYDTSGRKDGLGVQGEYGGKDQTQKLYKLDSIKVYSINERVLKGSQAIPIRIIHFDYSNELCPKINNTIAISGIDNGKLTLKKVSFSSGKSRREALSPYEFSYGSTPSGNVINPEYNPRNVNRWGNFQPNTGTSDININTPLSNIDFPYSSLNEAAMTEYSYAWNLTHLKLPSGGSIQVQYEPHKYAYTQDKRCMQMFTMVTGTTPLDLQNTGGTIVVNLNEAITGSDQEAYNQLLYKYFNNNLDQFYYYKALVMLMPGSPEWISGYFKIKKVSLRSNRSQAVIELSSVCRGDNDCDEENIHINPIRKNAWQFMRMNRPEICYGLPTTFSGGLEDFLRTNDLMSKVSNQIEAFRIGFEKYAYNNGFAKTLDSAKSFIRLYSPNKNKIIGGTRVQRVITDDNWSRETLNNSESKLYTIDYSYTDTEKNPVNGQSETISSGVMEYEPFNGQDENPMREPIFMNQHIKMAPDNHLYVETPFNESLFPAPNITYAKVKITANQTDFQVPKTGYQEMEYYTAKDFPVLTNNTSLGSNHEKKTNFFAGFAMSILGISEFHDYVTLSQGTAITLNDMHGKPKATRNYNSSGSMISSEQFEYSIGKTLHLIDNHNRVYTSDKLGISASAICDSRSSKHKTEVNGVNLNLDLAIVPPIPMTMFNALLNNSVETTMINTVALNKIIYKKGILTKKTVTENGAAVSTENMLFDDKTGFVVLSKTTNEFNDTLFKFHYPANWIYNGLGAGYISSDLKFTLTNAQPFNHFNVTPEVFAALELGDEIIATPSNRRFWVMEKIPAGNAIRLETEIQGTAIDSISETCQVLRPGRRNQLMQEAGSIVTRVNPIDGSQINFSEKDSNAKIINASMQEFSDLRIPLSRCDSDHVLCPVSDPPRLEDVNGIVHEASHPVAKVLAAKVLAGFTKECTPISNSPVLTGSTVRWRIGVANVGNAIARNCQINDVLPQGFTYAGNARYWYGMLNSPVNASNPLCSQLTTAVPADIGVPFTQPSSGSANLTWNFAKLPFPESGPPVYFIIDFDVLVGPGTNPGKYCNTFTFFASGLPVANDTISATSNTAQVTVTTSQASGTLTANRINPFFTGENGNWYPTTTWSYLTDRIRTDNAAPYKTNTRSDGSFSSYSNFWKYGPFETNSGWKKFTPRWQWIETITKKDVNGLSLETSDVLDRHNALLTGYKNKLVVAEAGNAHINEILFDGFEDWNYLPIAAYCDTISPCVPKIVDWGGIFQQDASESHTGKYSGKLLAQGLTTTIPVAKAANSVTVTETDTNGNPLNLSSQNSSLEPLISSAGVFKPTENMKYVFSAWVRDDANPLAINFDGPSVRIGSSEFHTSGNIIDGWQRIDGEFEIPAWSDNITFKFMKGAGNTWLDDIRIYPIHAKIITYVYDSNTQKLTFTSDENNYFTKFNYDAADNLESINKETEKGVQTIKEARSATVKKQ